MMDQHYKICDKNWVCNRLELKTLDIKLACKQSDLDLTLSNDSGDVLLESMALPKRNGHVMGFDVIYGE
jgi:hypothetical protein